MKNFSLVVTLFFLVSCENDTLNLSDISIADNETFSIAVHQKALYNNSLSIVTKQIEDSRCPTGFQCIWAGNANVEVDLIEDAILVETIELCNGSCSFNSSGTGKVEPDTTYFTRASEDYMLILYDVTPYPNENNQYNTKRAQLKLVRF